MGASILECVDGAVGGTSDDYRRVPEAGGFVISRIGNLGLEAEKIPCSSSKNRGLFPLIYRAIGIDLVGNPCQALARPVHRRRSIFDRHDVRHDSPRPRWHKCLI